MKKEKAIAASLKKPLPGMSFADIARATGHDVKTVKKYIDMEDFNQPSPKPGKNRGSKLDHYKETIDGWLEAAKQERKKQRHTALRVYNLLNNSTAPVLTAPIGWWPRM